MLRPSTLLRWLATALMLAIVTLPKDRAVTDSFGALDAAR